MAAAPKRPSVVKAAAERRARRNGAGAKIGGSRISAARPASSAGAAAIAAPGATAAIGTESDQRQRVGGLQVDDVAARQHRARFGDADDARRDVFVLVRLCAASPAAARADRRRGRRSAPRRRIPAPDTSAVSRSMCCGTCAISSSHSRRAASSADSPSFRRPAGNSHVSRSSGARYCLTITTRPSSSIGISTTDGRVAHDLDVVLLRRSESAACRSRRRTRGL